MVERVEWVVERDIIKDAIFAERVENKAEVYWHVKPEYPELHTQRPKRLHCPWEEHRQFEEDG